MRLFFGMLAIAQVSAERSGASWSDNRNPRSWMVQSGPAATRATAVMANQAPARTRPAPVL